MKGTGPKKVVWSAADYASNSAVQQTWARELIAGLKLRGDERVLDVGCGDGKITAELARALPRGFAAGVDASPQMIEFAARTFSLPNLKFRVLDARRIKPGAFLFPHLPLHKHDGKSPPEPWVPPHPGPLPHFVAEREKVVSAIVVDDRDTRPSSKVEAHQIHHGEVESFSPFDIVFSNAALHWVDDHEAFLRGAASVLRPGGRLMVSCGGKGNAHEVFLALLPEMRLKRWREFFRKMEAPYFFHSPEEYKKWLARFGFKTRSVKLAPKDATYPGRGGFAAWLRTTWLPYTQRVPENAREEFIAGVVERYNVKHPADARGLVHVRMVRLEIDATKQ